MKKKILLTLTFSLAALVGCTKGLKPNDPDVYRTKTGIIGVFRQSAFYCENVMPQYITLGAQKVIVKPGWSNEQDNLFISEMKPGIAPLYSYEYACGEDETKLKLDTADNGKKPFPYAVKIPDQGFTVTPVVSLPQVSVIVLVDRGSFMDFWTGARAAKPMPAFVPAQQFTV